MTQKVLSVPDISCGHCKVSIEGAVKKLKGVSKVDVDVDRGLAPALEDGRGAAREVDAGGRPSPPAERAHELANALGVG